MVDVVINYYNPQKSDLLFAQTLYCILCYKRNKVKLVILSDGSGIVDERFSEFSKINDFVYLTSDKKLMFSEGYNVGVDYLEKFSESEYVLLSANDIFVDINTVELLIDNFEENCGCVIPYLSVSDLPIQNGFYNQKVRYPMGMTLNVNMFKRSDLIGIGKVPVELSGYFNDVVMFYKLKKNGKKIKLINAGKIIHLGKVTVSISSNASFEKDKKTFIEQFGECAPVNKYVNVKYSILAQTKFDYFISAVIDKIEIKWFTYFLLKLFRR